MTNIYLITVIVALLIYISIKEYLHTKQINKLTEKIMSKDYREFKTFENMPKKVIDDKDSKKKKVYSDGHMGSIV